MTPARAAAEGGRGFAEAFGGAPAGVWRAPGRVNLVGEHTDYQLGLCLPIAIDRHTVVVARMRADRRVRAYSATLRDRAEADLDALAPGERGWWFNYVAGVLSVLRPPRGCDLYVFGDLPVGAGLSSSAALEVAVSRAVNDLFGLGRSTEELALAGQTAERAFAGVSTGILDQFASAFGREGHALVLDTRARAVEPVPWRPEEAGLLLAVVDTRVRRQVSAGTYQKRFEQAHAAASALGVDHLRDAAPEAVERLADPLLRRRARHIVSENGRVPQVAEAAGRGDWAAVGRAFYDSHRSLAEDYEVSHPALDAVVETARATGGALGARLTGAGFGGSAIALLEAPAAQAFAAALRATYARRGWDAPTCTAVRAGPGAGRVAEEGDAG